jgi:hypothetical protein
VDDAAAGAMRALVLHPDIRTESARREPAALEEAVSLAVALPGLEVLGAEVVRLPRAHPGTLFGKGKIEEIGARLKADDIGLVLIDGPVSPVQQRNLEKDVEGQAARPDLADPRDLLGPRAHPRRRAAGRDGGTFLSAHPACPGLDPP